MDFDEILTHFGEFGVYQNLMIWLVLLPGNIPCALNAYNQIFMAKNVNHFCKIPELEYLLPENEDLYKNISIPQELRDGILKYSKCKMYNFNYTEVAEVGINIFEDFLNFSKMEPVNCKNGWIYDTPPGESSIISEWDLVCDKEIYPTISLVIFGTGGLLGNLIFGYIQDGFGRKPAFFIYLFILCFFGISTAFANNFVIWTVLRFGAGFTIPAIMGAPMILALEIVGTRHRTLVNLLSNIVYSLGLVGLSAIVYYFRDWRQLSLVTSIPFLFYFLYYFSMPESPRWLISQRKVDEVEEIMKQMARLNGKPISDIHQFSSKFRNQKIPHITKYYGVLDLVRTPNLRIKTVIITFIWFTTTSVYVGLSYYAPNLGGDEYLNFFLAGVVELPTYLFLWPSMANYGRRWILCGSMVTGGVACMATFLAKNDSVITLILYCIAKMSISSTFVVVLLITSELYPTVIRGLGMSICSVFGGMGPIVIPLINYLGTEMLTLPLIIMGVLLILGGLSSILLPETFHKNLPQTLEDGEKTGIKFFKCFNNKNNQQINDNDKL